MFLPQKHGDGFFAVSNEQTDLPSHIIICTLVWTATSSQPLSLESIWQLLRYSGPPQLPVSRILLILCLLPPYTWRLCLMDQGATMWCLFCWNGQIALVHGRANAAIMEESMCYCKKKVVQRSEAFLQWLDLQQLHIPWDPGGLSVCEQTAA